MSNAHLLNTTLQEFDPEGQSFDIVLLHNSINHLDEEACINLLKSSDAKARYDSIFSKLRQLGLPGSSLIIVDASRYNFFSLLHLKNPVARSIEWHKHQSPTVWARVLGEYGFSNPKIRWSSFNTFRELGRFFLGNRIASYFLTSHFVLQMRRR